MTVSNQEDEFLANEAKEFSIDIACESPNFFDNLCEIIHSHQDESARVFGMSILHILNGNHDDTLRNIKFLIKSNPDISLLHRRLGEIHISRDDFETAAEHLEEALKLDKEDLTVIIWLGLIHFKLGNEKKAQICFDLLKDEVFF